MTTSSLNATFTQPLARGFLSTSADRVVDLAGIDVDTSASQFRQKVTQVLQQVLVQYFELQYALGVYDARRQSKDLALVQYEGGRLRVQNGLLPPVALTSARAEIAARERDLLQAEVQIITAENALKLLISPDPSSPLWRAAVSPRMRRHLTRGRSIWRRRSAWPRTIGRNSSSCACRRPRVPIERLRLEARQASASWAEDKREDAAEIKQLRDALQPMIQGVYWITDEDVVRARTALGVSE